MRINPLPPFSSKYNLDKLVYYAGSRKKKTDLIYAFNPEWKDLYNSII